MSFRVIPHSGTMGADWLDELRQNALAAVDDGQRLPEAVTAYLKALEKSCLDTAHQRRWAFIEESWNLRTTKEPETT